MDLADKAPAISMLRPVLPLLILLAHAIPSASGSRGDYYFKPVPTYVSLLTPERRALDKRPLPVDSNILHGDLWDDAAAPPIEAASSSSSTAAASSFSTFTAAKREVFRSSTSSASEADVAFDVEEAASRLPPPPPPRPPPPWWHARRLRHHDNVQPLVPPTMVIARG